MFKKSVMKCVLFSVVIIVMCPLFGLGNAFANNVNKYHLAPAKVSVITIALLRELSDYEAKRRLLPKAERAEMKEVIPDAEMIYPLSRYLESVTAFYARRFKIATAKGTTIYLRRHIRVGEGVRVYAEKAFIINCSDEQRAEVIIGNNVHIMENLEVYVKGSGRLVIEDGTIISKEIKMTIAEDEIVLIRYDINTKRTVIKKEKVVVKIIDELLRAIFEETGSESQAMLGMLNNLLAYLRGEEISAKIQSDILNQINSLLEKEEADYFIRLIEEIRKESFFFNGKEQGTASGKKSKNKWPKRDDSAQIPQPHPMIKEAMDTSGGEPYTGTLEEIKKILKKKLTKKTFDLERFRRHLLFKKAT